MFVCTLWKLVNWFRSCNGEGLTDSRVISKDYFLLAKQLYRGTVSFVRLAAGNNSTPNRQICLKTGTEITVIPWVLLLCETARMFHSADISYLITKEATANVYSQTHISIQITAFHRNVKVRAMSVIQYPLTSWHYNLSMCIMTEDFVNANTVMLIIPWNGGVSSDSCSIT